MLFFDCRRFVSNAVHVILDGLDKRYGVIKTLKSMDVDCSKSLNCIALCCTDKVIITRHANNVSQNNRSFHSFN